jgi:HEAT repeat protein
MFETLKVWWYIRRLRADVYSVRRAAVDALGELGSPRTLEPLIQALGDEDDGIRYAAAVALGKLGDPRAVEPLVRAVGRGWSEAERRAAVQALGKLGDPRALEPLIQALGDKESRVRRAAAVALGMLGDPRAVEPLIRALGDVDSDVRRTAAEALVRLGQASWQKVVTGSEQDFKRLAALGDPRAVEPLLRALGDRDWKLRAAAAEAMELRRDPRTVEPLIQALGGGELVDVSPVAARALGKQGDPRAVQPLIRALKGHTSSTAAAEALGELGDRSAVEPLIDALYAGRQDTRLAAARALNRLGDSRAVEPLIRALGDGDSTVRLAAAEALEGLGEASWHKLVAGDDKDFKRLAASGDPRAVEPLVRGLYGGRRYIRRAAAEALIQLASTCPAAVKAQWSEIRAQVCAPHADQVNCSRPDGTVDHSDSGIGIKLSNVPGLDF